MDRRRFVAALGPAIAWPGAAFAQSPARVPRICFFSGSSSRSFARFTAAFLDGMHQHGWAEGRNVQIDFRWADGRMDLLSRLAGEVVKTGFDVIFATGLTQARVVWSHTKSIPIVSALLHDPVAEGFARSWSRPGGNVTGMSTLNHELLVKRLQIVREMVPGLKMLAVTYEPSLPNLKHGFDDIASTSAKMGIRAVPFPMTAETDIEPVFASIRRQRCEAVIVPAYPLVTSLRAAIAAAANRQGLPSIGETVDYAAEGGLASHGPDWAPLFHRAASHVDRILRGAKPGDLPIEQPTHYELVLNQKTAANLGISFPKAVILRADRVIE